MAHESWVELCTVCDKAGTMRCGSCKVARFCSARCQAIFWPAHKPLCGRPLDVFFFPPLTPIEVEELERVKDKPYQPYSPAHQGGTFRQYITGPALGLTWEVFLEHVRSAPSIASADSSQSQGLRNDLLVRSRTHLLLIAREKDLRLHLSQSPLWHSFSGAAERHVERCVDEVAETPGRRAWDREEPWRILNGFLRQELVRIAVESAQGRKWGSRQPVLDEPEVSQLRGVALGRALVELDRATEVPPQARAFLKAACEYALQRTLEAQCVVA